MSVVIASSFQPVVIVLRFNQRDCKESANDVFLLYLWQWALVFLCEKNYHFLRHLLSFVAHNLSHG